MYDNPEIVPDPLREYADTLEQYTSILQAHADKKYGAYVIHYPKGGVEPTGNEVTPSRWHTTTRFGGLIQWRACPTIVPEFTGKILEAIQQVHSSAEAYAADLFIALMMRDRHPETGEELDLIN